MAQTAILSEQQKVKDLVMYLEALTTQDHPQPAALADQELSLR